MYTVFLRESTYKSFYFVANCIDGLLCHEKITKAN